MSDVAFMYPVSVSPSQLVFNDTFDVMRQNGPLETILARLDDFTCKLSESNFVSHKSVCQVNPFKRKSNGLQFTTTSLYLPRYSS